MLRMIEGKRMLLYLLGMNIMSVGILLSTRTNLGVAAISSVAYSYSTFLNISFGMSNFILFIIFIATQAFLLRSLSYKLLLQIPMAFLVGLFIDLYDYIIPVMNPKFTSGLFLLILSNVLTGIGVYGMTKADLILDPGNAIVETLCRVSHKPFPYLRIRFDVSLVLFTILSGLIIVHKVVGVGLGTIISAYLIGKTVGVTDKTVGAHVTSWMGNGER